MKKMFVYVLYLLIVWGGFRYFFDMAPVIEELWFKPVVWLLPLFWWNLLSTKRVVFFEKNSFFSLILGLVLGVFYMIMIRLGKMGVYNFDIDLVGVALATAIVEEMAFSGFVLGYLLKTKISGYLALYATAFMVVLVRLPILFFDFHISMKESLFVILFVFSVSTINGYIRWKTRNTLGSVLARFFLNLSLFIF